MLEIQYFSNHMEVQISTHMVRVVLNPTIKELKL